MYVFYIHFHNMYKKKRILYMLSDVVWFFMCVLVVFWRMDSSVGIWVVSSRCSVGIYFLGS